MKSEIIYSFEPEDESFITDAFLSDKNTIVLVTLDMSKDINKLVIHIIGKEAKQIDCSIYPEISNPDANPVFFKYKNGFGFLIDDDTFFIWETPDNNPIKYKIENTFLPDKDNRQLFPTKVMYNTFLDVFDIILGDFFSSKHSSAECGGRYWSQLKLEQSSSTKDNNKAKWIKPCFELPLINYPKTEYNDHHDEYLNIISLYCTGKKIFFHTNGGNKISLSRRINHEFGVIGIHDTEGDFIEYHNIEEGSGSFSSDGNHYIIHSDENRKRVYLYDLEDLKDVKVLSLTPKQNIGKHKANSTHVDLVEDMLIVYNTDYLNLCKCKL